VNSFVVPATTDYVRSSLRGGANKKINEGNNRTNESAHLPLLFTGTLE
jgi:hypothetical protein